MQDSIANVQAWTNPDPARVAEMYRHRQAGERAPSHRILQAPIAPVDLYAYLKWRFGSPNGFAMALRAPSVDNLIHWNYTVQVSDFVLDILGLTSRTELVTSATVVPDSVWNELESRLVEEVSTHRREIGETKRDFEHWNLFVNPYQRLARIVSRYESRLGEIVLPSVEPLSIPSTAKRVERFQEELQSALDLYEEAAGLCVSLQMIAPVMGEAAINFILMLMAKPDIKADQRLKDDFARRAIDVRIKTLHLSCDGFAKPVDANDEIVKDFLRLMNRRNDSLHGNVNPARSSGGEIMFDYRTIPLPSEHLDIAQAAISSAFADLSIDDSLADTATARHFVEFMLSCIDSTHQPAVREAIGTLQLGYRPEEDRIGVILPHVVADMIPGLDDPRGVSE
jgi:hypothetical protein